MSAKANELKLDIEDFNNLLKQATRQKTKDAITVEIRKLQTELANYMEDDKIESIKPSQPIQPASQKCYEVKLNNYGWDQTNTTLKLYVTLKDVQQLPKESIICNFDKRSLDLHVLRLDNRNYNLSINNLCEEIDVDKSNFKVKTDMIVLNLVKKVAKDWSHVTSIEKKIKEAKTSSMADIGDDPASSLMNFMKNMYQDGDDDMKRTIAKAWTESQQKKVQGLNDFSEL